MSERVTWNEKMTDEWLEITGRWVSYEATEANPAGLTVFYEELVGWLDEIGFELEFHTDPAAPYRPVIVAKRAPVDCDAWIGFFHHYDVEPIHEVWKSDPWTLVQKGDRVFGRGIADNIGPFAQRLMLFEKIETKAGLLLVIQGEEEIGSPWAHELFERLELPDVSLWIDETGYFYKNGDHRILVVGEDPLIDSIVESISRVNDAEGRSSKVRKRFLTKAFGLENCPCIAHLLRDKPYLAIGPNDDTTKVHGPDESMDLGLLGPSSDHLIAVLQEVGS